MAACRAAAAGLLRLAGTAGGSWRSGRAGAAAVLFQGCACFSSSSSARRVIPLGAVAADGWTPQLGRVASKAEFGVFVDFGCERPGLLPLRGSHAEDKSTLEALSVGDPLTVYVISRQRDTGKINLSLKPRATPRIRLHEVIADGRTPYEARVMNVASFGTFFDIGTELQALLPHRSGEPLPGLRTGDPTTVYIVEKRRDTGKLLCSLEPDRVHRFSRQDLVADGRTPYGGRVTSVDPRFGAFVDLGCEANGILPLRPAPGSGGGEVDEEVASLRPGDEVVAYIFQISRHTGKVSLTLRPRTTPLVAWEDVVADGQTRHDGVVIGKTDYGAFVDIGCAHAGFVPLRDFADIVAWDAVQVGSRFPMYVYVKSRDTGKITLSMHRSPRPRERWEAIVCDGQTPYEGHVISTSWYGVFVDIGCECHGRLPAPQAGLPADSRLDRLRAGDKVTAYVVEKRPDSGKVTLSLTRRASPLTHWKDLVADGQTPYEGFVTGTSAQGEWVDLNCDRLGLLPRRPSVVEQLGSPSREEELEIGSAVRVYVLRRNPTNGRLILALAPSATPRLPLEDALREPAARHDGLVYALDHARAFVDFGCEAGGVLPRSSASVGLAAGHRLLVHAAGFDADSGRVLLARARPPPPPRPSP